MKKILMSIFVLILLVFSSFGAMADELDESNDFDLGIVGNSVILANQGSTARVNFKITGQTGGEDISITYSNLQSPTDSSGNTLEISSQSLIVGALSQNIETKRIDINIPENAPKSDYIGKIRIEEVGNAGNYEEVQYTIKIPNPSYNLVETDDSELVNLVISGQEETNPKSTFRIKNNGNVVLEDVKMVLNGVFTEGEDAIRLKVGDSYLSTDGLNPINLGNLNVGQADFIVEAQIPSNMNEDSYEGTVTISAEGIDKTFSLVVRVEPPVCKDGRVSDEIPVNNPGDGNIRIISLDVDDDSLDIGETIDATVEVETNDDFDIVIEAMLYNVDSGKEIIDWVIVVEEALDDDRDSYDFTLEIPVDNDEIDPSDTYILYVKAYEDGDENKNCNYDGIEMEIGRDSDNVIVTEFTITPLVLNILNSGHTVQMSVNVLNIGEDKQEDVYVKVMNTELGLDLSSNKFDLKEYDKSDNEMSTTLNFQISEDAVAGTYQVEARVYFKDGREYSSLWMPITVEAAAEVTTTPEDNTQNEVVTGTVTTGTTQTYNPTGGFLGSISGSSIFWVIGDVVLAILVIVLLVLIFRRK